MMTRPSCIFVDSSVKIVQGKVNLGKECSRLGEIKRWQYYEGKYAVPLFSVRHKMSGKILTAVMLVLAGFVATTLAGRFVYIV